MNTDSINSASLREYLSATHATSCVLVGARNEIEQYEVDGETVYLDNAGGVWTPCSDTSDYEAVSTAYLGATMTDTSTVTIKAFNKTLSMTANWGDAASQVLVDGSPAGFQVGDVRHDISDAAYRYCSEAFQPDGPWTMVVDGKEYECDEDDDDSDDEAILAPSLHFTNPNNVDLTGYSMDYYFPGIDHRTATDEQLRRAYMGPDQHGVGVEWTSDDTPRQVVVESARKGASLFRAEFPGQTCDGDWDAECWASSGPELAEAIAVLGYESAWEVWHAAFHAAVAVDLSNLDIMPDDPRCAIVAAFLASEGVAASDADAWDAVSVNGRVILSIAGRRSEWIVTDSGVELA